MNGEAAHRTCYRLCYCCHFWWQRYEIAGGRSPLCIAWSLVCIETFLPCTAAGATARHATMPRTHACQAYAPPGRRGALQLRPAAQA